MAVKASHTTGLLDWPVTPSSAVVLGLPASRSASRLLTAASRSAAGAESERLEFSVAFAIAVVGHSISLLFLAAAASALLLAALVLLGVGGKIPANDYKII